MYKHHTYKNNCNKETWHEVALWDFERTNRCILPPPPQTHTHKVLMYGFLETGEFHPFFLQQIYLTEI